MKNDKNEKRFKNSTTDSRYRLFKTIDSNNLSYMKAHERRETVIDSELILNIVKRQTALNSNLLKESHSLVLVNVNEQQDNIKGDKKIVLKEMIDKKLLNQYIDISRDRY